MTQHIIESPAGPVIVWYLPGRLILERREQDFPGAGDWSCEMTMPYPGKSNVLWHIRWRQSECEGHLYYQEAAKKGGLGGFTGIYRKSPWRDTIALIERDVVPVVHAWGKSDEAAFAKKSAIAQVLRNKRTYANSQIAKAERMIAEAQDEMRMIDAWLAELAPPFPGGGDD